MTCMRKHMIINKINGLLTKKRMFFIILIILLSFIAWYWYEYNTIHSIKYELIYETELDSDYQSRRVWFSLRNPSYDSWDGLSPEYYDDIKLNYDKYTYIVTLNHELVDISYSFREVKTRKLIIFPKQFVGFVTLKASESGKSHLYKIRKMDIDYDYHAPDNNVVFISE